MIIRIFKITIHPEMRSDFERDFASISVEAVKSNKGLVSWRIGLPTKWNPDEYAMITVWESECDLAAFAGDDWHKAVIPAAMTKYPRFSSVEHFKVKDSADLTQK